MFCESIAFLENGSALHIVKDDFAIYINMLSKVSGIAIASFDGLMDALRIRMDHFGENGEYPEAEESLKKIVEGIAYYNAKDYFAWIFARYWNGVNSNMG